MSGLTRKEVADRAGVDSDYVGRLIELDVLTPEGDMFSSGDVRRARLLKSLEQAGIPLDGIGAAVGAGQLSFVFVDLPNYDRFSGLSGKTFRDGGSSSARWRSRPSSASRSGTVALVASRFIGETR